MRRSRRIRPTIWPTRPNPAMITWFSSSKCRSYSGSGSCSRRALIQSPAMSASGVAAIESVTATISRSAVRSSISDDDTASARMTKANSPPCESATAVPRTVRQFGVPARATTTRHSIFTRIRPSVRPSTMCGVSITSPMLTLMPTAMKNRPRDNPLKGSISASSWCRYWESASSTPARNAPSAIDRPTSSISRATPTTVRSAVAVNTSCVPNRATRRRT